MDAIAAGMDCGRCGRHTWFGRRYGVGSTTRPREGAASMYQGGLGRECMSPAKLPWT